MLVQYLIYLHLALGTTALGLSVNKSDIALARGNNLYKLKFTVCHSKKDSVIVAVIVIPIE